MSYQKTGNNIPVRVNELRNHVDNILSDYDKKYSTLNINNPNPYNDPIIYTTQEGKQVQVPNDIQNDVIREHYMKNKQKMPIILNNSRYGLIKTIIYIIVIILAIYLLYQLSNKYYYEEKLINVDTNIKNIGEIFGISGIRKKCQLVK